MTSTLPFRLLVTARQVSRPLLHQSTDARNVLPQRMFNATTIDLKEAHAAFEKPNTDDDVFLDVKQYQGWRASANSRPTVAVSEKALAEFDSWYASSGMGRESFEEDMALLVQAGRVVANLNEYYKGQDVRSGQSAQGFGTSNITNTIRAPALCDQLSDSKFARETNSNRDEA